MKLHQFSSVAQSCLTLRDPMDCGTPGLPVHHQLLESTQTHVHYNKQDQEKKKTEPDPEVSDVYQHIRGMLEVLDANVTY